MLRENIKTETVTAMKAKEKARVAALRLISAKLKDRDIELRTSSSDIDDDALVIDVLQKMAKQRRESIQMYQDGGRTELADQETRAAIEAIKGELSAEGMKDMGRVMGELKKRHGTELDMGKASGWVKDALA